MPRGRYVQGLMTSHFSGGQSICQTVCELVEGHSPTHEPRACKSIQSTSGCGIICISRWPKGKPCIRMHMGLKDVCLKQCRSL